MTRAVQTTSAVLLVLVASAISALASGLVLMGDAMPSSVQADGRSFTRIAISATGSDGKPAPDGTEVRFSTTAGSIPTAAYTNGGRATAILISPTTPQVAMVTATALGSSTTIQVEFSATGGDVRPSARVIRLKGGSLAYAIDRDIVLASENITLEYGGMTITATSAQISETLGTIRAQGSVHIRRSSKTFDADAFYCDLRSGRCRVLTNGTTSMVCTLSPDRLQTSSGERTSTMNSMEFSPLDAVGTKTWIISKRLTVFPGEKIQFFKASIYVGDARVLSVPYYSFSYENRESILQQVRYSSQDGLVVNFPLYYHMADSSMGAFKLQYSGSGNNCGIFAPRKGMSLGLEQGFSTGGQSDGKFSIDSICDSQRSFRLSNHLDYGGMNSSGRVDISTQYQPTSAYAKGVYTTSLNSSGGFGKIDYSVCGYLGGSRVPVWNFANAPTEYADQSSGSITSSFRPRQPFSVGRGVNMTPSLLIGYGRPGAWYGGACGEELYQSLGLNFNLLPLVSNRNWNLTLNSSSALTTTMHGEAGTNFRTGADLRRSWQGGSASLSYTLNLHSGNVGTIYSQSVHNLGASLFFGSGARWSCNAYAGYGIDTGTMNLYSSASCQLAKTWRVRTSYTFYRYMCSFNGYSITSDTSYLKAGIYHPIGPYEVGVAWSPEGQQYGLKGGKRVWLEIGSSGF